MPLVIPGQLPDPDNGRLDFGYDGSFLLSETWSVGAAAGTVAWVYNNDFRVIDQKLTCVAPATCSELELSSAGDDFVYDADGLLVQAGDLVVDRYAATGLVSGTTLSNVATTQSYYGFGELAVFSASDTGGGLYREEILSRDSMGRITARIETIDGVSTRTNYEYWEMGRLKRVSTGVPPSDTCVAGYTYDNNGNRLSTACGDATPTATYDAQDRLLTQGGTSFEYNLSGSLETKTSGPDVQTTFYDASGNLLTVVLPDATQIDYAVDPRGRRIGKKVNGTLQKSWLYQDGLRPVAEFDEVGNLHARFVYASGRNVPHYMITYAADGSELATYRIVTDHLGSVRLVVDASTGVVAQRMVHDEWGQVIEDTNPGFQPFGFAGGIYDPDTGLVRFGARDYDPTIGRWTAKDPILFDGGQANLYAYVGDDPLNRFDPRGLSDYHLGCEADGAFIFGIALGFGVFYDSDDWKDSGVYGFFSLAVGLTLGVSGVVGYTHEISGVTDELDLNAGFAGVGEHMPLDKGSGGSITLGPGVGVSATSTNTGTTTINEVIDFFEDLF